MRVFDVWESQEPFERFASDRLLPAIQEEAQAAGMEPREPRREIYELHDFIRP
jgi:hypothetical protein